MSVVGPSGSGKSRLIFKMLASPTTFKPTLGKIYYFYKEYQPHYDTRTGKLPLVKQRNLSKMVKWSFSVS